jgi:DNA modification methylase
VEPPRGPAVTRPGDLWLLGEHRILCADARDRAAYTHLLGEAKAQMIFTDPPFNLRIDGHVGGLGRVQHREFAMASGEMSEAEFQDFLRTIFRNMADVSADGAIHFVCMDWRHIGEVQAAAKNIYSELKNLCVWNKDNGGMGSFYRSKHELVFVFKNGTAPHINNFGLGEKGRYRTNVWDYAGVNTLQPRRAAELAMHPTVKPVALVMDAIKDCSKRKGIILDAFGGSGTTLIAAHKTGRRGYLLEIDPLYVDVAVRRWEKLTGKVARHAETGRSFDETAATDGTQPGNAGEGAGRG